MDDFDVTNNIVDEYAPPKTFLKGCYKKCFAYECLKHKFPTILLQVVKHLLDDKDIIEHHRKEINIIVENITNLSDDLLHDGELLEFEKNDHDSKLWNDFIIMLPNDSKTYFSTCWLYAECYLYRKLKFLFEKSIKLKDYDYFKKQKQETLASCTGALELVIKKTRQIPENANTETFLHKLLKLNLWGNRCDLSLSNGIQIKETDDQFGIIDQLNSFILINHFEQIWQCLTEPYEGERIIDVVNDNSGYELFTDFILTEYLIDQKLATKIRFNVKAMPWFVSDVTPNDFQWTLQYLRTHKSKTLSEIGQKWSNYVDEGKFVLNEVNYFWTSPYEFYKMNNISSDLYKQLTEAHLIIFKGDLNYRKLIGDFTWNFTTNFETCLGDFHPTNLCTLRTIKADLLCGLQEGKAEDLDKIDPLWMLAGNYGVIKFSGKKKD